MDFSGFLVLLKDFFDVEFLNLIGSTLALFTAIFFAWYFYHKQLAKRDLFERPLIKQYDNLSNVMQRFFYVLKYLVVFPIYSFIWFVIFSLMLLLLSKNRSIGEIFFFGIVVVAATRIAAYVSRNLAEDMAKLLPWVVVVAFLTDPPTLTIETFNSSYEKFIEFLPRIVKYLFFITFVEWVLRGIHWIYESKPKSDPIK